MDPPTQALYTACEENNVQDAENAVAAGADINSQQHHFRQTPLMVACSNGSVDVVSFLLSQNVFVNVQDQRGVTALIFASRARRPDIVNLLLRHRNLVDIDHIDNSLLHATALIYAVRMECLQCVKLLIEAGGDWAITDSLDRTIVEQPTTDPIRQYLEDVIKTYELTKATVLPLEQPTSVHPMRDFVKQIPIKLKSDLMTELRHSIIDGLATHDSSVEKIRKKRQFIDALIEGKTTEVSQIFNELATPHDKYSYANYSGFSRIPCPLIIAIQNDNHDLIRILLDNGADPTEKDQHVISPFMMAVRLGNINAVQMIIDRDESVVHVKDNNGNTALHIASGNGYANIVDVLLRAHAKCDVQNSVGNTALMEASKNGHRDTVQYLLKVCASCIYKKNKQGDSALTIAHHRVVDVWVEFRCFQLLIILCIILDYGLLVSLVLMCLKRVTQHDTFVLIFLFTLFASLTFYTSFVIFTNRYYHHPDVYIIFITFTCVLILSLIIISSIIKK